MNLFAPMCEGVAYSKELQWMPKLRACALVEVGGCHKPKRKGKNNLLMPEKGRQKMVVVRRMVGLSVDWTG